MTERATEREAWKEMLGKVALAEALHDATCVGTIQQIDCFEELGGSVWATVEIGGNTRVTAEAEGDDRTKVVASALQKATDRLRTALDADTGAPDE